MLKIKTNIFFLNFYRTKGWISVPLALPGCALGYLHSKTKT